MNKELSPALQAELRFLRAQVDRLEQAAYSRDSPPEAKQKLHRAREELREFTTKLRWQGYTI